MSLGEELKRARENSGLSIAELASLTSLRQALILEMESNQFSNCGGDTYARGHIKTIAGLVGADPEKLLDLYTEEHSNERRNIHDLLVENNVTKVPKESRTISWKVPAAVSLSILGVVAIAQIVISNIQSSNAPEPKPLVTASPTESASTEATPSTSASPSSSASASQSVAQTVSMQIVAARGSSHIDIVVDGQHVEKGSIFQGETKSYQGNTAISIYFSNPAGLDVTVNGKLLAPLGAENQEVRRTFRP